MRKNEFGCIVLDDYKQEEKYVSGRKKKIWFEIDGEKYLFKSGASNYEIYAELISCELARQFSLETADYQLATYNNEYGVITKNFLKESDYIISLETIMKTIRDIAIQNNINSSSTNRNSVESILLALDIYGVGTDIPRVYDQLCKIWIFDGIVMESDRHENNLSLIRSVDGYRMSPIYDCSTMARMNNNILELVQILSRGTTVSDLTKNIQYSLAYRDMDFGDNNKLQDFLGSFEEYCNDHPESAEAIMENINNMNVNKAIEDVENRINQGRTDDNNFNIPWEVSYWLNSVINLRLMDMQTIYQNSRKNISIHC